MVAVSAPLAYAISTLFTWGGIFALLLAIYFLVRLFIDPVKREALNAYALWQSVAVICVVMAIVLPHALGGTEPPIRLPLMWPVMPFTLWAALLCSVVAVAPASSPIPNRAKVIG